MFSFYSGQHGEKCAVPPGLDQYCLLVPGMSMEIMPAEAQKPQQRAGQWEAEEHRNKFLSSPQQLFLGQAVQSSCVMSTLETLRTQVDWAVRNLFWARFQRFLPTSTVVWLCDPPSAQAEVPDYASYKNIHPDCKQTLPSANAVDESFCLPWPWSCFICFGCEKAIIAPDNGKSQLWGGTGNPISQALQSLPACLAQFLSAALSKITALKITHTISCAFRRRKDLPSMWVSLPLLTSSIPRQLNC